MSLITAESEQTPPSLEDDEVWRRHTAAVQVGELGLGLATTKEQLDDASAAVRDEYIHESAGYLEEYTVQ